jgi:hypothetical protein
MCSLMLKIVSVSVVYISTPFDVLGCGTTSKKSYWSNKMFEVFYIDNSTLGYDMTGLLGLYWYTKNEIVWECNASRFCIPVVFIV